MPHQKQLLNWVLKWLPYAIHNIIVTHTYMTKKVQHSLWGTGSSTWFITTKQLLLGTDNCVMATTKKLSCNSLCLICIICIRSLSSNSVHEQLWSYPHLSNTGMIKWIKATKKLLHSASNKKFWCKEGKWPLQQSEEKWTKFVLAWANMKWQENMNVP